jgi:1-acyl-sn-glycerol-3-phosphate acyltransferase
MRHEQEIKPGVKRDIVSATKDRLIFLGITAASPIITLGSERINKNTPVNYEEGFWQEFIPALNEGYVPLVLANHESHFDGTTISKVAGELTHEGWLMGFMMPLAASLDNGDQGGKMKALYRSQYPLLRRNSTVPLNITREKDKESYNEKANLIRVIRDLVEYINEGYGIVQFPEGETTGGKIGKSGIRNGMIPFKKDAIRSLLLAVEKAGRMPLIIPVSIDGGFRVLNPDRKLPTRNAIRVGMGRSNPPLVNVTVGFPIKADEGEIAKLIKNKNWVGVNEHVGRRIAGHLPQLQRGVYA